MNKFDEIALQLVTFTVSFIVLLFYALFWFFLTGFVVDVIKALI
jgi:hypothetical protein